MTNGWGRKRTTANDIRRAKQYASTAHRKLRKQLKAEVDAGRASCWRCGKPILPGSNWELGHNDAGTEHRGPEHFTCNRSAAARKGALIVNAKRRATRLTW